jgi:hypothetical protein
LEVNVKDLNLPLVTRRHLRKEMIVNFSINLIINGLIAWFAFSAQARVPMWGEHSFGGDLAVTTFFLCWIIGAIVVATHRAKAKKDQLPVINLDLPLWLPKNPVLMGLLFAVLALLVYYPATLLILLVFGFVEIDLLAFSVFKGFWAGVLACLVIPPAMIFGLATANKVAAVNA